MPRPRLCRRISSEPSIAYFKPAGVSVGGLEQVILTLDEFEALRLKDLEGLEQTDCAGRMNISQPTFHRLVTEARRKVADALVNGKGLMIEGGNVMFPGRGRRCRRGGCRHESGNSE